MNPFEETFRRAIEQKNQISSSDASQNADNSKPEEDSLHTPQFYPQPENAEESFKICHQVDSVLSSPTLVVTHDSSIASIYSTQKQCDKLAKDILIAGKCKQQNTVEKNCNGNVNKSVETDIKSKLIKAEVINLSFPPTSTLTSAMTTAIPVQTVKPFILPKIETSLDSNIYLSRNALQSVASAEPSSASLTPTSQLPIKERLKAILNSSIKSKPLEPSLKPAQRITKKSSCSERTNKIRSGKYDEDCMERRRAAATRYRNKMKNEHFNLQRKNEELQNENKKLKDNIKELQAVVEKLQRTGKI